MFASKLRSGVSEAWSSSSGVVNNMLQRAVNASMGTGSSTARYLSSAVHVNEASQGPVPGPTHINPVDLSEDHVSQVYCVSKDELRTVFPHGLSTKFASMVDSLGRGCWLLRRQSYEIMKVFKDFSPERARDSRFLLYGLDGCGKSICLSQVVHWSMKSGWTVVHIPSVFTWSHSKEEVRASTKHPGTYDQPKEAVTWLKNFKSLNNKHLTQIELSEDHTWTKREKSTAGDSLTNVIEQGLLRPNIATEVMGVVLMEVAKEAKKSKTLLAVDDFNGCFNPTSIKLGRKEWAEPEQLNLLSHLKSLVTPGNFPGGVVLSLSRTKMYRHHVHSCKPEDLLGPNGVDALKDVTMLEVPHFDRTELNRCISYYSSEKWFNKSLTPETAGELWILSSGNPAELHRLCSSL